jgi:hypothetical protein
MEKDFTTTKKGQIVSTQTFDGKTYKLYENERYFSRGTKRLHTDVWIYHKGEIPKGYHVHHVDGDTKNNSIDNLNLIYSTLHMRYEAKKRFKNNPEFAKQFHAKGIEAAKEWHKSEEGREWHSQHGKNCWINKEYRTLNCQHCNKEYQTRHSGISKFCHNNCKAKARTKRIREQKTSI